MRSFHKRPIGASHRLVAIVIAMLLVGAACSGGADTDSSGNLSAGSAESSQNNANSANTENTENTELGQAGDSDGSDGVAAAGQTSSRSAIADLITELPPAPTGLPVLAPPDRQPTGLTIDALGVDVATVIAVGIEDNGDMEIPPADQVGWYQYGPTPGASGSSVLAAHIAFDGENGVFVELDGLALGSLIEVSYDDGTTATFEAVSKEQYDKNELPQDEVWGRNGDPRLVLITCGGDFNRQVSSYEDNIVIYANPVDLGRL